MTKITPSTQDIALAKESSRVLAMLLDAKTKPITLQLNDPDGINKIAIPNSVSIMLLDILTQIAKGNHVSIVPLDAELTTQEAANILKVSRPFIIGLLDNGKIAYRMVGTRRKILFEDLMVYKESMYRARLNTLDKLTKDAQDLDMGY